MVCKYQRLWGKHLLKTNLNCYNIGKIYGFMSTYYCKYCNFEIKAIGPNLNVEYTMSWESSGFIIKVPNFKSLTPIAWGKNNMNNQDWEC